MDIQKLFSEAGGQFVTPVSVLEEKLSKIKAFVFDWDGVFNDGSKGIDKQSTFAEPDSMGTNLIRFSYWLQNQETFPYTAIVTGENNKTGKFFAEREHFDAIYLGYKDKADAISDICKSQKIKPDEILFVFDDILDLSVAKIAGVRFQINRKGNPLLEAYLKQNQLVDYISSNNGSQYGVREICELILGISDQFETVVQERVAFSENYKKYIKLRNLTLTQEYTFKI